MKLKFVRYCIFCIEFDLTKHFFLEWTLATYYAEIQLTLMAMKCFNASVYQIKLIREIVKVFLYIM